MEKIIAHDNWSIHSDIINPLYACLPSRNPPVWTGKVNREKNWKSAQVVNSSLVNDPNYLAAKFQSSMTTMVSALPFLDSTGPVRRNKTRQPLCPCGEIQMMSHTVNSCSLSKLYGGFCQLLSVNDEVIAWLTSYGS